MRLEEGIKDMALKVLLVAGITEVGHGVVLTRSPRNTKAQRECKRIKTGFDRRPRTERRLPQMPIAEPYTASVPGSDRLSNFGSRHRIIYPTCRRAFMKVFPGLNLLNSTVNGFIAQSYVRRQATHETFNRPPWLKRCWNLATQN